MAKRLVNQRPNEVRIGNFIVRKENDRILFIDLSNLVSHSIALTTAKGVIMAELWDACNAGEENAVKMMEQYLSVMEFVLCVVPFYKDSTFLADLYSASEKQLELTKPLYARGDEDDDEKILDDERTKYGEEQELLSTDAPEMGN